MAYVTRPALVPEDFGFKTSEEAPVSPSAPAQSQSQASVGKRSPPKKKKATQSRKKKAPLRRKVVKKTAKKKAVKRGKKASTKTRKPRRLPWKT